MSNIFLDTIKGISCSRPPVWFMRQAGRILPSYRKLKENHHFYDMMKDPELASDVTLLPINDLGVDSAILFSDILVIPDALGLELIFTKNGPKYTNALSEGSNNELDFVPLGSPQPDFYYGFRNTLSYKNWTLDIFIQGMQGNEILDGSVYEEYYGRGPETNMLPIVADRWTVNNQTSDIPRAGTSAGGYRPMSSLNVVDGSYLRLRNVTLSYDFDLSFAMY